MGVGTSSRRPKAPRHDAMQKPLRDADNLETVTGFEPATYGLQAISTLLYASIINPGSKNIRCSGQLSYTVYLEGILDITQEDCYILWRKVK